jgi:hypothetical protein
MILVLVTILRPEGLLPRRPWPWLRALRLWTVARVRSG